MRDRATESDGAKRMRRPMQWLREYCSLWFGLGLFGAACLVWALISRVLLALRFGRRDGRMGRAVAMAWFRLYLRILSACGAFRLDISELDALRGEGPLIIAPNHPSLLDAVLIISRVPDLVCIMKSELTGNLLYGGGARLAGYIGNDPLTRMIRHSVATLRGGNKLLLFPEGTRTVRQPVNRLTAAVGLIAHRARAPVQTVFIESDSKFLCKGWSLRRRPSLPIAYRVRLGKRYDPPGDVRAFISELERYFENRLEYSPESPALTAADPAGMAPPRFMDTASPGSRLATTVHAAQTGRRDESD
jgi:1-acyl-sn-glycerol-3-phosphate acyltransferase